MSEDIQVRNFSPNTQLSYLQQVSLFARYFDKSPDLLGREDVRTYQVYLANEKKLGPGSIHTAISALRFLYKVTLERDWVPEEVLTLPKKPQKLPIILSPKKVQHFLGCVLDLKHHAILTTCYARAYAFRKQCTWRRLTSTAREWSSVSSRAKARRTAM